MNQTRFLLVFAWLMVATLLWMEWGKEQAAPRPVAPAAAASIPAGLATAVPEAPAASATVPASGPGAPAASAATPAGAARAVTVTTDVLRVTLTGGELQRAELLRYPSGKSDRTPVQLLSPQPALYFVAQTGWVGANGAAAPTHTGAFQPLVTGSELRIPEGARELVVPFEWRGPNGVVVRREYVFPRVGYTVQVRDRVSNAGAAAWQGFVYRQLARVPRELASKGPMSAEQYSFQGAAWYTPEDKYNRCAYEDFGDDCALRGTVQGGWIAMLQHHFFAAWIPPRQAANEFSLATAPGPGGAQHYLIRAVSPAFTVAPGQSVTTEARLWVGPKLVNQIEAQDVPGLNRAVDFSRFDTMATLAGWLFWVLDRLHGLFGNWGWAIVGLVVLIRIAMFPLAQAQYRSMAKMRKFQPRIEQLKERYGDDRQKFQMAMMELYKKEKINPVGGCLPILIQMPVFLALYWMLSESVELRHAPWMGWIQDLTARDPYFVLPLINIALMWATQKLTPMTGMDPMQQKMLQLMPIIFGVMFAFFPAGLVLYWVTNSALGLAQQYWMTRKYAADAKS
ncbi:MAG TPA: membrane protein insertase YidC [Lysobacter sp.]|nr:membrane protein insertase YidC [Lysobacter sp.]